MGRMPGCGVFRAAGGGGPVGYVPTQEFGSSFGRDFRGECTTTRTSTCLGIGTCIPFVLAFPTQKW